MQLYFKLVLSSLFVVSLVISPIQNASASSNEPISAGNQSHSLSPEEQEISIAFNAFFEKLENADLTASAGIERFGQSVEALQNAEPQTEEEMEAVLEQFAGNIDQVKSDVNNAFNTIISTDKELTRISAAAKKLKDPETTKEINQFVKVYKAYLVDVKNMRNLSNNFFTQSSLSMRQLKKARTDAEVTRILTKFEKTTNTFLNKAGQIETRMNKNYENVEREAEEFNAELND